MDIIYSRYRLPKLNKKWNIKKYIFIMFVVIAVIAYSTALSIINSIIFLETSLQLVGQPSWSSTTEISFLKFIYVF